MVRDVYLLLLLFVDDNKLHRNSSRLHLATHACESLHSQLLKYFYHPHPDINILTVKLKEYQTMIYVESRSVNFPATVTNIRSHDDKRLVGNLIKEQER